MATDKFPNMFSITCLQSGVDTLTFKKLESGYTLGNRIAWCISRLDYFPDGLEGTLFNAALDRYDIALVSNNTITDITDLSNPIVIDCMQIMRVDFGTPANGFFSTLPIIRDFSNLPGGGLLVPAAPLYLAVDTNSIASARTVKVRGFYTEVELKGDEFWELVQQRNIISS